MSRRDDALELIRAADNISTLNKAGKEPSRTDTDRVSAAAKKWDAGKAK